jgi:REP element-mobilizing transposase RayT
MSTKYKVRNSDLPYFVTATVVGWVSALSRSEYRDIILDSLRHCVTQKGLNVHAWVIMNDHIHLIVSTRGDTELPGIMRDFKKYTSRKVIDAILTNPNESRKEWMINMFEFRGAANSNNDQYQFWRTGYHPIELDTEEKLLQRLSYLHENPVRAGIVREAADYLYSSAIDYVEGERGLLDVSLLF